MSDNVTIVDVMQGMPGAFRPEKAAGVEAVIQYHFTGEGAGDWVMTLSGGTCRVERGSAESPKLTITSSAEDYVQVGLRKLEPMAAFAAGKLKLQGDLALAMKMISFFGPS